jgi:ABC-type transport system involved in multi-copper enzyme maturation permease subunit
MKLELKRNNLRTYIIASVVICVIMTGFLYLFAYAPQIDPDPDLQIFAGYNNLISMFSIFSMAVFATLSAIMYVRFVIEEYKDKRAILLFSYPVKRNKIFMAKLAVVFLFTIVAMTTSNLLAFGIFGISENVVPLVDGELSVGIWLRAIKITVILAVTAAWIGVVAMGIGFFKKSVPTTIVSAVLLSSLFCNIIFNALSDTNASDIASLIFMGITTITGITFTLMLTKNINNMEV